MTRIEKYKADQLVEAGVAKFLDDNFYSKLSADVTRWNDTEHQFAGIDVTVNKTNFDEKIKIRGCLNSVYNCPSFEMSLKNKAGAVQNGWFNSPLSTDYYAYIGVYAKTNDENSISASSNIMSCDVLWVKKTDVVDMIEEQMTFEQLKTDTKELREDDYLVVDGKSRKTYSHRKFWLTYSAWLAEKPVNLVVPRANLEKLPHSKHFIVSRKGVKVL